MVPQRKSQNKIFAISVENYHSLILLFLEKPEKSFRFFFFISSSTTDESVEQTSSSMEIEGCSLIVFCLTVLGLIWLSRLVSECAVFGLAHVNSTGFTWMSCEYDRTIAEGLVAFTAMLLLLMLRLFGGGQENRLFLANVSSSLIKK